LEKGGKKKKKEVIFLRVKKEILGVLEERKPKKVE
jgi:hypothetical protein